MSKSDVFKGSIISALIFTVLMAVVSLVWRRVIFGDLYAAEQFFHVAQPTPALFAIGISSYFLVGLFFAMLYGHMVAGGSAPTTARIIFIFGALYWLAANYTYIGRVDMQSPLLFLGLEAISDAVVFAGFGIAMSRVFKKKSAS